MKTKALLILGTLLLGLQLACAQGAAFTYQGRLNDGTNQANGRYDFQFQVFDAPSGGSSYGSPNPNTRTNIAVSNGLFTVGLDFGAGVFTGPNRWLDITVRTNGNGAFTPLTPRQALTPTPYAIYSGNAASAGSLSGTLPAAQLTGTVPSAALSGANGSGLTSLNASQLTSGTVPDARLSANVALLNAPQTFSGANNFLGNIGIGTISPQTLFNVDGTARIDAVPSPYAEGLLLNCPTNMSSGGYGGIHFHNAARGGAIDGGTIKWSVFYSVTPENGAGGKGLAFIQNNANTRLYLGTNGNVGIGTPSPVARLHVHGDFNNTGAGGFLLDASDSGNPEVYALRINPFVVGGGAVGYQFQTKSAFGGTNVPLTFDNAGKVGIGTQTPAATLDVNGTVRAGGVMTTVGGLVIETRAGSDPASPAPGRIWLRTDL